MAGRIEEKVYDEQSFKMYVLRNRKVLSFPIETESTVLGFPDVMVVHEEGKVTFEEYKYSKTGKIKFQPTQPAFYKKYGGLLHIEIVAFNAKSGHIHVFSVRELFNETSPYCMDENAMVDLRRAEK